MSVAERISEVKDRISQAARRSGRQPDKITLVAVTKNVPAAMIAEAIEAGITEIGENRVQEAAEKYPALQAKYPAVNWQMVGHLQRNKVRQALDIFAIIQSVDSERLAEEISRLAVKPIPVLIEVNTSGETSKFGVEYNKAINLVRFVSSLNNIQIKGLMTLGPLVGDPRPSFRRLRELKEKITAQGIPGVEMKYLSMGMSGDFEAAVEEGSNLVRIGRAIFKEEGNHG